MIKGIFYRSVKRALFILFERNRAISMGEAFFSRFPSLAREHCKTRQIFLTNERKAILEYTTQEHFKKLVVVGGGPVPFTALFWADSFDGPIIVLDKDKTATSLGERLVKKMGLSHILFVNQWGEDYGEYEDCIVIISLFAENKSEILKKILQSKGANRIVLVRVHENEAFDTQSISWKTIHHGYKFFTLISSLD